MQERCETCQYHDVISRRVDEHDLKLIDHSSRITTVEHLLTAYNERFTYIQEDMKGIKESNDAINKKLWAIMFGLLTILAYFFTDYVKFTGGM